MFRRVSKLGWGLPSGSGGFVSVAVRGAVAAMVAIFGVLTIGATGRALLADPGAVVSANTVVTVGSQVPTSDNWTSRLTDPSAWSDGEYLGGGRMTGSRSTEGRRSRRDRHDDDDDDRPRFSSGSSNWRGTYRTVCVRLCDGYFFPISFATTREHFARDAAACESSCRTSARLYIYPNPGGEPEEMTDLEGQPYSALKSAFLFRTNYNASCTCKPHPWEKEALDRHRAYAAGEAASEQPATDADRTRTVARTVRVEVTQPEQPSGRRRSRPEGAMLLGSDEAPRRASRSSRGSRSSAAGSRDSDTSARRYGGARSDSRTWRDRAFGSE